MCRGAPPLSLHMRAASTTLGQACCPANAAATTTATTALPLLPLPQAAAGPVRAGGENK